MASPKEIRKAAGLTLIAAAVGGGVAENTVRLYEADRDAVSEVVRNRLDAFYRGLRSRIVPPSEAPGAGDVPAVKVG